VKLKSFTYPVVCLSLFVALTGCKTEGELIVDTGTFVTGLGADYSVAKASSQQRGYSVVRNNLTGKYFAIDLRAWNSTMNAWDYYDQQTQNGHAYFNLRSQGNGDFLDTKSQLLFESSDSIAKDGQAQAGFVDQLNIASAQRKLIDKGVSSQSAKKLAAVSVSMSKKSKLSSDDVNAILEVAAGTSLSELAAARSSSDQEKIVNKAAKMHGMSPESVKEFLQGSK
jgi:hypothetical protein